MLCPYCSNQSTKVVDKRDFGGKTKRRRECLKCKKRFNTFENAEGIELKVLKKDGRREEFDINKIRKGIRIACEKRPVNADKIEKITSKIVERLRKKGKEVESKFIGDLVIKELRKIDDIAYIRFASVYREFGKLSDFKKEMREL